MRLGKRGVIAVVVATFFAVLVFLVSLTPMWPGPNPPAGATRLAIRTAAPHLIPTLGCPDALLLPVRITSAGDQMVFVSSDTGAPVSIVWPTGWAAWRGADGIAVLARRDGSIAGREGDVLSGYGGGVGDDGAIGICIVGS
jgi:hypothetical protein